MHNNSDLGDNDSDFDIGRGQGGTGGGIASVIGQLGKKRGLNLKKKNSVGGGRLDESFHSIGEGEQEDRDDDKEEEDAFFDAQDYFDADLVD